MVVRSFMVLGLFVLAGMLASCAERPGGTEPKQVPVYPVKGQVTVDGKPAANVRIKAVPASAVDAGGREKNIGVTTADDGKFELSIYSGKKGIPEGEYALTFTLPEFNVPNAQFEGDDLNGRYDTVEKSPKKFKVEKDSPVDLGTIELTTQ